MWPKYFLICSWNNRRFSNNNPMYSIFVQVNIRARCGSNWKFLWHSIHVSRPNLDKAIFPLTHICKAFTFHLENSALWSTWFSAYGQICKVNIFSIFEKDVWKVVSLTKMIYFAIIFVACEICLLTRKYYMNLSYYRLL